MKDTLAVLLMQPITHHGTRGMRPLTVGSVGCTAASTSDVRSAVLRDACPVAGVGGVQRVFDALHSTRAAVEEGVGDARYHCA